MKALITCQFDLAYVIHVTPILTSRKYGSGAHIFTIGMRQIYSILPCD